jgi:hypothetical protein
MIRESRARSSSLETRFYYSIQEESFLDMVNYEASGMSLTKSSTLQLTEPSPSKMIQVTLLR